MYQRLNPVPLALIYDCSIQVLIFHSIGCVLKLLITLFFIKLNSVCRDFVLRIFFIYLLQIRVCIFPFFLLKSTLFFICFALIFVLCSKSRLSNILGLLLHPLLVLFQSTLLFHNFKRIAEEHH